MASPWKHPRTGIFHIRVGIPEKLRDQLPDPWRGKREYKRPLIDPVTGDKARSSSDAKRLWADAWADWMTLRSAAEAAVGTVESVALSDRQIAAMCAVWVRETLDDDDSVPTQSGLLAFDEAESQCHDFLVAVNEHRLPVRAWRQFPFVLETAKALMAANDLSLNSTDPAYRRLCEGVARYGFDLAVHQRKRLEGDWSLPDSVGNAPKVAISIESDNRSITVLQLAEKWFSEKNSSASHRASVTTVTNGFIDLHDNIAITSITVDHVREYKDRLVENDLANNTIKDRLGTVRQLIGFAVKNGYISENVAENIRAEKRAGADHERIPFTIEQLNEFFSGPVHAECRRDKGGAGEAQFWLPILGLYSGSRLQDLAQLLIVDVLEIDSVGWFLDVNKNGGKQVKNDFTPRIFPVHEALVRLGFLEFVKRMKDAGEDRLFPLVTHTERQVAKNWGQWFGRYQRSLLGPVPPKKKRDFHSLRHTFRSAAENCRLNEYELESLQGHKATTTGRGYGHNTEALRGRREAMNSVRFHDFTALDHLMKDGAER